MPVQGVGSVSAQQSLFQAGGAESAEKSEGGDLKQQAGVKVLKSQLDQQESSALQLINSSVGLGQNVDFKA